jgi:hypothetical protein
VSRVDFPSGPNGLDFGRGGASFAVAAWVKFDDDGGGDAGAASRGVLARVVDTYERFTLIAQPGGSYKVGLGLDAPITAVGERFAVLSGGEASRTRWQHVAACYDREAKRLTFYVDGHRVGETAGDADPNAAFGRVGLGCRVDVDGKLHDPMRGAVDELVILRRAVTADEVRRMHDAGKPE